MTHRSESEPKWHISLTMAGKRGGEVHCDIGADDNENIALVYPAEDGREVTLERANLFCEARETKRELEAERALNREMLEALKAVIAADAFSGSRRATEMLWLRAREMADMAIAKAEAREKGE